MWHDPPMQPPPVEQDQSLVACAFRRSLSPEHARLMESTCRNCRVFVAASVCPELLYAVEKLHVCPDLVTHTLH
jgi:hypothetical protein